MNTKDIQKEIRKEFGVPDFIGHSGKKMSEIFLALLSKHDQELREKINKLMNKRLDERLETPVERRKGVIQEVQEFRDDITKTLEDK